MLILFLAFLTTKFLTAVLSQLKSTFDFIFGRYRSVFGLLWS